MLFFVYHSNKYIKNISGANIKCLLTYNICEGEGFHSHDFPGIYVYLNRNLCI